MFVAVVSNVYQLYLILTNRENTSCVDKYILRVASVVRCVAAQYRVHIMTECPLTAFPGGLQRLHQAGPDAVEWLSRLSLKL